MNVHLNLDLFLLTHVFFYVQTNAEPTCPPVFEVEKNLDFFDKVIVGDFKVWQLAFMTAACGLIVTIVLCCIFKCRIPRTRQEIEAAFVRRRITKQFRKHLNKIPVKDVELNTVLPKVVTLEETRLQKGEENEKKTLKVRFMALFAREGSVEKQMSIEEELPSEEMKNKVDAFKHQISIEFTDMTEMDEKQTQETVDQNNQTSVTVETVDETDDKAKEVDEQKSPRNLSTQKSIEREKSRKLFKQATKVEDDIAVAEENES